MDDKFVKNYPSMYEFIIHLDDRINELKEQNDYLKYQLERYEKAELANGATRKFVNDNMFVINYMEKYLRDIGAI